MGFNSAFKGLICELLVSVILRLFRRIFLISTFPLDMVPLDIIKRNLFFFSMYQVTRLCNLEIPEMLRPSLLRYVAWCYWYLVTDVSE